MANASKPIRFDLLSPKLCSLIFVHLKSQQLLSIRLVCYRWKQIVDRQRSLWDRICVKFDEVTLDENFPVSVAPASKVHLKTAKIVSVDSWWPSFAERLTFIQISHCSCSMESVLRMLQRAPNLTQLELCTRIAMGDNPEVLDFRLEKMRRLVLIGYSDDLLDLFGRLCPHLQELCLNDESEDDHDAATARLIESVQDALQRLELWMTPYVLHKISLMERLQLKSVHLTNLPNDDNALSFIRLQPCLEELNVNIEQNSILCEIGRNLPGLKRLGVVLHNEAYLAILATMPLLEKLDIACGEDPLNGLKCPNLTELTLQNLELEAGSLQSFLSSAKNVKKLKLTTVALDTWSDLLAILTEHPSLRHLDLWFVQFEHSSIPTISSKLRTNLEYLRIYPVTPFSNKMLLQLTKISPHLTTLELHSMKLVKDATVRKLCQQLPRLKRLILDGCSPTEACAGDIVDRCLALEYLRIDNRAALCEEVRKLLRARGDGRCVEIF